MKLISLIRYFLPLRETTEMNTDLNFHGHQFKINQVFTEASPQLIHSWLSGQIFRLFCVDNYWFSILTPDKICSQTSTFLKKTNNFRSNNGADGLWVCLSWVLHLFFNQQWQIYSGIRWFWSTHWHTWRTQPTISLRGLLSSPWDNLHLIFFHFHFYFAALKQNPPALTLNFFDFYFISFFFTRDCICKLAWAELSPC